MLVSMKNMKNNKKMILDNTAWAELYEKFRTRLINSLNGGYCLADREDAVEFAFDKLMHRKDVEAYRGKYPRTEKDWLGHLYWQARSFLSHLKARSCRHAKYVEFMSKALEDGDKARAYTRYAGDCVVALNFCVFARRFKAREMRWAEDLGIMV